MNELNGKIRSIGNIHVSDNFSYVNFYTDTKTDVLGISFNTKNGDSYSFQIVKDGSSRAYAMTLYKIVGNSYIQVWTVPKS